MTESHSAPSWHALFAPLPADATPRRQPVAPPEVLATPAGAAIAGWERITVELSAGTAGMRVATVTLDATGQPISASDYVLYVHSGAVVEYRHETVGGRLEPDGTFLGTRWLTTSRETTDGEELETTATPSEPTAADVAALRALVAELLRRAGGLRPG